MGGVVERDARPPIVLLFYLFTLLLLKDARPPIVSQATSLCDEKYFLLHHFHSGRQPYLAIIDSKLEGGRGAEVSGVEPIVLVGKFVEQGLVYVYGLESAAVEERCIVYFSHIGDVEVGYGAFFERQLVDFCDCGGQLDLS